MKIEEPEDPVGAPPGDPDVTTIGEFYNALVDKIDSWSDGTAFSTSSAPPVVSPWYPQGRLFPIDSAASAVHALKIVVEQGEGTAIRPTAMAGEPELAHYYRFAEIVHGHRFVPDANAPEGFSYTGDVVGFDATAVYPLFPDATLALYAPHPAAHDLAVRFATSYRHLLTCLQKTFRGSPDALEDARSGSCTSCGSPRTPWWPLPTRTRPARASA